MSCSKPPSSLGTEWGLLTTGTQTTTCGLLVIQMPFLQQTQKKRGPEFHQGANWTGGVSSGPSFVPESIPHRECLPGRVPPVDLALPLPVFWLLSAPHLPSPHQSLHAVPQTSVTSFSSLLQHHLLRPSLSCILYIYTHIYTHAHTYIHTHLLTLLTPLL